MGKIDSQPFSLNCYFLYSLLFKINHQKKLSNRIYNNNSSIFAGATGNLIDSIFYGKIFSESTYYKIAEIFPTTGGYADFLHGKVVDMFYFPVIDTILPDWVPIWGGERFIFFQPVFNFADASITVGFFILILFYNKFLFK